MSAPVLTLSEQKQAISGKKKKKQTMKNILNIPNGLKTETSVIKVYDEKNLCKILERLLPTARLPVQSNTKKLPEDETNDEENLKTEAQNKRNQLSIGVNALNRSIKKDLISAVLLASDIQPKFLIHHLNLLCSDKKIPFLHMSRLRELTKNNLGFPCIALGFKKDFNDFSEAVNEIKSISKTKVSNETEKEIKIEISESSESEVDESEETEFTYLYRTTTKERVFVPEQNSNDQIQKKSETNVIKLQEVDVEQELKSSQTQLGISNKFKKKNIKKLKELESAESDDDGEDFEVPKKKVNNDWVIDKKRKKHYYPPNVRKFHSNPNRVRKKRRI